MFAKPQREHEWFNDLIGNWEFTHECNMGPDQPPVATTGTMVVRTLGGLWFLLECQGQDPQSGEAWSSLFTLGYDPAAGQFTGSFVASMMTHFWRYSGQLDETGKSLILDAEGPGFDGQPLAKYQDIITLIDRDHWTLHSRMLGANGEWIPFMEGHHHRVS